MMKQGLIKWKKKQDFFPGALGIFVNPFFIARRGLVKNIAGLAVHLKGDLLDIGCGRKPYEKLFKVNRYVGMDIENPGHSHEGEKIDVFYDGKTFPFENETFDALLCNQVLEHVFNPTEFLAEINRVAKPGAKLLLSVPFSWDEHEQPFDFARYSSFGLKHMLEQNGFKIESHIKSVSNASAILQLWNTYLYKILLTKSGVINAFVTALILSPFTILGILAGTVLPSNRDFYLDNVILARKS